MKDDSLRATGRMSKQTVLRHRDHQSDFGYGRFLMLLSLTLKQVHFFVACFPQPLQILVFRARKLHWKFIGRKQSIFLLTRLGKFTFLFHFSLLYKLKDL